MVAPRRYSQEEVDNLLAQTASATKAELQQLRDSVGVLAESLGKLSVALTGVPGISKGAIDEIRDQIAQLQNEWRTYQAALPAAINAGVEAHRAKDSETRGKAVSNWWLLVTANAVSGVVGGVFVFLITHHW